jgi:dipeptidyl aminopeptidase/acylaminoacyl peptidase
VPRLTIWEEFFMRASITFLSALLIPLAGVCGTAVQIDANEADAPPRPLKIDDRFALRSVKEPRVSPDGAWVAFTVETMDLKKDESESRVWMVPVAGGEAVVMTAGGSSADEPRWSPDGKYLSFLSDREKDIDQVFVLDRRGGEARQITDVKQGVEAHEWSPDSSRLVLVIEDPEPDAPCAEEKDTSDENKVPKPWVIDRLQIKNDDDGYLDRRREHLYIFTIENKELRQITFGDYEDSDPVWSPDGRLIAFVSNRSEEPDANYNTDLWVVDPNSSEPRESLTRVTSNPGSDGDPAWHPDSRRLAYITITQPDLVDFAQTDVAVISVDDPRPSILTATLDRMVHDPRVSPDGSTIYFRVEASAEVALAAVPFAGGPETRRVSGRQRVEDSAVAADGTVIALVSTTRFPAEIFALGSAGEESSAGLGRRLTHVNDRALKGLSFPSIEKIIAASADGTEIEALVYKPPGFKEVQRYPTILWPHGGPMAQHDWGWDFEPHLFAANGYVVVLPNPRGSTGYGQEFCRAIWADWGNLDRQDILAAIDRAIELGYADGDRLGVGGWSYGGILTNYVVTSTSRFKAAMSGASGALWVANYGHDMYQHWYEKELGLPWETRDVWERMSPFNKVERITTPTLWMGGEKDWNVPIQNSEQMYQAMRRLGRETQLVVYPEQDHGIDRPSYTKDLYTRWIAWFDKYLKGD